VKTDPVIDVVAYEAERASVKAYYTTRLKSLSASGPEYARLWNERISALATLAEKHGMPTGTEN
jgi:hypothetical protein